MGFFLGRVDPLSSTMVGPYLNSALRSGSIPMEIEAARGINDMSELRPADALLINIDGDFGNTIRFLGARLYSDVTADCI
ncbi:hypothetical protein ASC97_29640 [Rhizobium sp. Root1203]|uniref:hypothetical protein n=1 Tax=Rhizobium sp. Root1203 TaxID=1736427 RepID=UPI0007106F17|nr:hypothetical protein [Rhizobium sp. Root1203]KQV18232.1 hypothetical protein ASC97_29640 [Rhizobium sp. Root1203]